MLSRAGHLPKESHDQVRSAFRAANKLDAAEGTGRLKQLARWLERDHPSAAASITEGLEELFTVNRLGLPASLRPLSQQHQPDRRHPHGRTTPHPADHQRAEWYHGPEVGGSRFPGDREELPQDHGLP